MKQVGVELDLVAKLASVSNKHLYNRVYERPGGPPRHNLHTAGHSGTACTIPAAHNFNPLTRHGPDPKLSYHNYPHQYLNNMFEFPVQMMF